MTQIHNVPAKPLHPAGAIEVRDATMAEFEAAQCAQANRAIASLAAESAETLRHIRMLRAIDQRQGKAAARALRKFGEYVCAKAYRMHERDGYGARGIANVGPHELRTVADANAAINAGRFMHRTAYCAEYVLRTYG